MNDHWQRIINHRQQLVDRLAQLNILVHDPDNMKTKHLEALINRHVEVVAREGKAPKNIKAN